MPLNWFSLGSLSAASAVAFGAFGAHGLKSRGVPDAKIASWSTAAQYQLIHSVALLVTETAFPGKQKVWAKSFFTAGVVLFSGSIYGLVLNPNLKFLGPVTPLGGVSLIAGWVALAVATRGRIALRS